MAKTSSAFTVKDVLKMNGFDEVKILAGLKGLKREVSSVSVMDAPDIYKWMKGGEILLTTAYIMRDDPNQLQDLVIRLNKAGAAALAIKLKRFIDSLPIEIIETANKLNFPILSLPHHWAFTDVINPVLSQVVNIQAQRLAISEKIHQSFTQIAIAGGGVSEIINTLSELMGIGIAFWDSFFEELYLGKTYCDKFEKFKTITVDNLMQHFDYHVLEIGNRVKAYIFLSENIDYKKENDYRLMALEHAGTVLKFDIQKRVSNYQIETRYRDEFIKDIIFGNFNTKSEIESRAQLYGWKFSKKILSLIVEIDHYNEKYGKIESEKQKSNLEITRFEILRYVRKEYRQNFDFVIWSSFSDYFVFLIEEQDFLNGFTAQVKKISDQIRENVNKSKLLNISIGIGELQNSVFEAQKSFDQAKRALKLGKKLHGEAATIQYHDLGIYVLLDQLKSSAAVKEFCQNHLGALLAYDQKNREIYLQTLECLADQDWNLKKTAQKMHLHYNTIKYRFQRLQQILGQEKFDSENKICLIIALKTIKMHKELFEIIN